MIRMSDVADHFEVAQARAGRRTRRWLVQWAKAWLARRPDCLWVKVVFWDDEEGDARVDVESDRHPSGELGAGEGLAHWLWYLGLTHQAGDHVRVTREGKIYRNKKGA